MIKKKEKVSFFLRLLLGEKTVVFVWHRNILTLLFTDHVLLVGLDPEHSSFFVVGFAQKSVLVTIDINTKPISTKTNIEVFGAPKSDHSPQNWLLLFDRWCLLLQQD